MAKAYIEARLDGWARWIHSIPAIDLQYPHRTVENNVAHGGGGGNVPEDPDAQEIEWILSYLRRNHKKIYRVVIMTYLYNQSQRVGAKLLRISLNEYNLRCQKALIWVEAFIECKKNLQNVRSESTLTNLE